MVHDHFLYIHKYYLSELLYIWSLFKYFWNNVSDLIIF